MNKKFRNSLPEVIFWATAVFLLFCSLGVKEIWGPEDRWAEIVREMRITGDYFHPTINGNPYFDKPLLSYWFIAAVSIVTGRLDETVLRLPSAIAGLIALWATIRLGKKLFSKQAAMTAGWILLSTYGFIFWARTGEADMENLAAIILAVFWYWTRREKPGFFSYLVFYLICFVGAHTKGMASIAVPILIVLPDMFRNGRWRTYVSLSNFLALIIGLTVYLAPFIYADATRQGYQASGLWFAIRENITRYFQPFDHKEPFYVYFYYVPKLFFPWTVLLVGAIWASCVNRKQLNWPTKWLVISIVLIFLFFTLSGSRRSYYIIPILPFCALFVSQYMAIEPKVHSKQTFVNIQTGVFVAILSAEILSPILWPLLQNKTAFQMPWQFKWATFTLGISALFVFILNRLQPRLLARLIKTQQKLTLPIVVSVVMMGGFFVWQQNSLESLRTLKAFSLKLKDHTSSHGQENIVSFKGMSPKILFHLDRSGPLHTLKSTSELKKYMASANNTWTLVAHTYCYDELAAVLPQEVFNQPSLQETVFPWEKDKKVYKAWTMHKQKP